MILSYWPKAALKSTEGNKKDSRFQFKIYICVSALLRIINSGTDFFRFVPRILCCFPGLFV